MNVLVIAAHPDDEALGCGGTIRRLSESGNVVDILFACDGESARGHENISDAITRRRAAACSAATILGARTPSFLDFPDNRLDSVAMLDLVQAVEVTLDELTPDAIYTHHCGDLNVDHQRVARAVLTACRPQPARQVRAIYAFEVLSSTEWQAPRGDSLFAPDRFVAIEAQLEFKLAALAAYGDEMRPFPHSRSIESVRAQALLRGTSVGLAAAEAFETIRLIES